MLGERIADLRRRSGLSQRELALFLDVSPSAVGMYEQNRREPSVHQLIALAGRFEVSLDFLLTGAPRDPREKAAMGEWFGEMQGAFQNADLQHPDGTRSPVSKEDIGVLMAALLSEKS